MSRHVDRNAVDEPTFQELPNAADRIRYPTVSAVGGSKLSPVDRGLYSRYDTPAQQLLQECSP